MLEPVQGEGGFIVPPAAFIPRVAEICKRHGILLIADEVQTGFGRTGRMFAVERSSVTPDLLVTSKSLGGGFPIGAVTGRAELMDVLKPGELGATFGGNPVACATALATIAVIERDGLLARAEVIGQAIRKRFVAMAARYASPDASQSCLCTGGWACGPRAGQWELCELRGSCTVLREPRGETPLGHSPGSSPQD